ncbi:MAG TPA: discoidin domain-containing protein, partial [Bacteroidota bacterium]|nr:discoidin domain-containing protein [Bacteroidota bacterium]
GGMALVCSKGGGDAYFAAQEGTYQVEAYVDPDNTIDELAEDNNTLSVAMHVNPPAPANLALNKPVTVSSIEGAGLGGENAVDGNPTSRWSSAFSDPQYIAIDLGAEYQINRVLLRWETAYARTYMIQVADSGGSWVPVFYTSSGDGGNDTIPLAVTGRLIKVTGMTRATAWGYSLYEFEVYGSPLSHGDSPVGVPLRYALHENYPNPFNPSTVISFDLPRASEVSLRIYDLLGREVATLVHGMVAAGAHRVSWRAADLASGVYFCRFVAGSYAAVKKLVLQK